MALNLLTVCLFTSLLQLNNIVFTRSLKQPICDPLCLNGYCEDNNVCSCSIHYKKHAFEQHKCIPRCNATESYEDGRCQKKCKFRCYGERCVPPVYCNCDQGWIIGNRSLCVPTCNPSCGEGTCTDWNFCRCNVGYKYIRNASPFCQPQCEDCKGQCIAPNVCKCSEGYETKYLTNDGRDCPCLGDCETKCNRTICIPDASMFPRPISDTNTNTNEMKVGPKLNVVYQITPKTKSNKGGQELSINPTDSNFNVSFIIGVSVCVVTTIGSFIVIILIIREIRK